jgi:hypothetical protein
MLYTVLSLQGGRHAVLSPAGHFRGSPVVTNEFVYVVQTDEGQQTLTPADFADKYGWKNDPKMVQPITLGE